LHDEIIAGGDFLGGIKPLVALIEAEAVKNSR